MGGAVLVSGASDGVGHLWSQRGAYRVDQCRDSDGLIEYHLSGLTLVYLRRPDRPPG